MLMMMFFFLKSADDDDVMKTLALKYNFMVLIIRTLYYDLHECTCAQRYLYGLNVKSKEERKKTALHLHACMHADLICKMNRISRLFFSFFFLLVQIYNDLFIAPS